MGTQRPSVTVLRLNHRRGRDARITSHCGLVARAMGATDIAIAGEKDENALESINDVVERWGGDFTARHESSPLKLMKDWEGKVVHLTMYGLPAQDVAPALTGTDEPLLLVIGGSKVRREVYDIADHNVAVTGQPHSEVAALAIFLHLLYGEGALSLEFPGPMRIVPTEHGKVIIDD
ncbi:MAG: hypothetical protein QF415_13065 [Candidatus Undinarchaeales archaeon]|nr:hypothetical protein [Candidatus Undinarchaeales archaeon]MDP7493972.1 hypothetical protein [Candidatus Undinarchaeales archaeon]